MSTRLFRLHRHFSFANLTALIALFVALGGSSYAALTVGTEQIADGGVTSEDLRNNDVRGRDIRKGTVRGTDVRDDDLKGRDVRDDTITGDDVKESRLAPVPSARDAETLAGRPAGAYLGTDAQTLGGKPASAFLASGAQVRSGLVKLAHGDTKTLTSSGPFTWMAACEEVGGTDSRLIVTVESTEANSFAADEAAGEPLSPGSPVEVFDGTTSIPAYTLGFGLSAVAPSGAAPTGLGFIGLNVVNADCVANTVLWP